MSSTNKTTNYNLSQFVGTDVPSYLGDYNSDMSKIDKAIGDVANSQGSVEQSVVGLTADVQGLSTQVSGVSTSVQQLQTSVAQIDSGYKQADTALSQRITTNANNIQTNTTAIESINTTIGTEDISEIGDGTIKGAIGNINNNLHSFITQHSFDEFSTISNSVRPNTTVKRTINFEKTYKTPPIVLVTLGNTSNNGKYGMISVSATNITTSSFDLTIFNASDEELFPTIDYTVIETF